MAHVFISYRRSDYDFVLILKQQLEAAGIATWIDDNIRVGDNWREAIDQAIKDSFATVAVMSPEAKTSEYVTYEWAFALGIGINVVPVMYQMTPLHPRLEALQYLDFTDRRNRPWDQLLEHLKQLKASYDPNRIPMFSPAQDVPAFVREAIVNLTDEVVLDELENGYPDPFFEWLGILSNANHPAAIEALAAAAQHPTREVRVNAAIALAESTFFEDERAIPGLQDAVTRAGGELRIRALNCLGHMANPATLPALIKAFEDKEIRKAVANVLVQIGPPALRGLEKLVFSSQETHTKWEALCCASQIGADAIPLLTRAATTLQDDHLVGDILIILGELGERSTIPTIVEILHSTRFPATMYAAKALGYFNHPEAIAALFQALNGSDERIVPTSLESLRRIGTREALEIVEAWEQAHPPDS